MKTSSDRFKCGFIFTAGILVFMNLASYIRLRTDISGAGAGGNFSGEAGFPLAFREFSTGSIVGWDHFSLLNLVLNVFFLLVVATAIGALYTQERYRFEVRWPYLLALPSISLALFSWRWLLIDVIAPHFGYQAINHSQEYFVLIAVIDCLGMITYQLPRFVMVGLGVFALLMLNRPVTTRVQHAIWNTIAGSLIALGINWFAGLLHL